MSSSILISTSLGLAVQGVVATSLSILAGLSVLLGSGFGHAAAFRVARSPTEGRPLWLRASALSLAMSVAVGSILAFTGPSFFPALPVLWSAIAVTLPLFQLGELGLGLHQGLGNTRWYLTTYVAQPLGLFVVAAIGSLFGGSSKQTTPLDWGSALIVIPFLLRAVAVVTSIRTLPTASATPPSIVAVLSYTARFYPSTLAHFLSYRLDLVIVDGLLGSVAAGSYSLALSGVDAVARLGQTAATVLYPRFASDSFQTAAKLARRVALTTLIVGSGTQLLLSLAVLGVGYGRAEEITVIAALLALSAPGGGAVCAWTVLASFLAARGRLAAAARVSAVLFASSVALYLTLIPRIGVFGGAIGTSVGLMIAAVLSYRAAGAKHQLRGALKHA